MNWRTIWPLQRAPFGELGAEDIFVAIQEIFGIIGHYGAANVCDLISDVLSPEAWLIWTLFSIL